MKIYHAYIDRQIEPDDLGLFLTLKAAEKAIEDKG